MYTIGYELFGRTRFRSLEVPAFPRRNQYPLWKNWAYPIKTLLQATTDFKLYRDFETPVADCSLFYEEGQWVMIVRAKAGTWTINSRTKQVTFEI